MTTEIKNAFGDDTLTIKLEIHSWGTRRPVKPNEVGEVSSANEDRKVDKRQLSMSKALVKCAQYDAITRLDREVRKDLSAISIPAIMSEGAYVFRLKNVNRAREIIAEYRRNREAAIEAFLRYYEGDLLPDAEMRLGPLFRREQYPALSEVSDAFSVEVSYPNFKPDGNLRNISEVAYQEALEDNNRRMQEASEKIQLAMRAGLLKLVANLSAALSKTREDGRPGIFHDSTIENVRAWLEVFNDRNLTADSDLEAIVARCDAVLSGVSTDDLRTDKDLRQEVVGKIDAVTSDLSDLIKSSPARRFSLDELPDTGTDG